MDLDAIATLVVDALKEALAEKKYKYGNPPQGTKLGNKIASGKLQNSISAVSNRDSISISMEDYGQYVQTGRRRGAKGVPISALLDWIRERNIKPRDMTERQLAFAIQRNIKKFGIRPSNWFDNAIDKLFDDPKLLDLISDSVEEEFEKIIDSIEGL